MRLLRISTQNVRVNVVLIRSMRIISLSHYIQDNFVSLVPLFLAANSHCSCQTHLIFTHMGTSDTASCVCRAAGPSDLPPTSFPQERFYVTIGDATENFQWQGPASRSTSQIPIIDAINIPIQTIIWGSIQKSTFGRSWSVAKRLLFYTRTLTDNDKYKDDE